MSLMPSLTQTYQAALAAYAAGHPQADLHDATLLRLHDAMFKAGEETLASSTIAIRRCNAICWMPPFMKIDFQRRISSVRSFSPTNPAARRCA